MTTIPTMIQRHDELNRELDRLYAADGDDAALSCPNYRAIAREAMTLEHRIIATRTASGADARAKREFVEQLEDIDLRRLLAAIFELDADAAASDEKSEVSDENSEISETRLITFGPQTLKSRILS